MREALQREIDAVPEKLFSEYLRNESAMDASIREYPAITRLDALLGNVMREVRETVVAGKPAVWLVYNMGIVVKTRKALFSVDLCHTRAQEFASKFDFAIITHNHLDHYTRMFYEEMDGHFHKTVITNFADNYGAIANGGTCGFARGERTYKLADVTTRDVEVCPLRRSGEPREFSQQRTMAAPAE